MMLSLWKLVLALAAVASLAEASDDEADRTRSGMSMTSCRDQDVHDFWDISRAAKQGFPVLRDMAVSIALVALMYFVQRYANKLFLKQTEDMALGTDTDKALGTILTNFSMKRVQSYRFRGLTTKTETATIEFRDLGTTVGGGKKTVLKGVTGTIYAGHLTAIMGPSGAGKTTFLNVLCGKTHDDGNWAVRGDVLVNGENKSIPDMKPVIGFVPQDDIVHEGLTVRENLMCSAHMRNPKGTPTEKIERIVADVVKVLQLEPQQNLLVGSRITGDGLSGGQRKRVNVGIELAATPTVLFLDEPTSGLDSTSSLMLMQQLKKMAQMGMTISMVIHQPRYSIFTVIDDVLLLGKGGRTVYIGPTEGAKAYFESKGFTMPANENPADWFMDVLSGAIEQKYSKIPVEKISETLFDAWEKDPQMQKNITQAAAGQVASAEEDGEKEILAQHCALAWREVAPDAHPLGQGDFMQFLTKCTGKSADPAVASEIIKRSNEYRSPRTPASITSMASTRSQDKTIELETFKAYLAAFDASTFGAHDYKDETSDSSDDESGLLSDDESGKLDRTETGFCKHFQIVTASSMIQWWRRNSQRLLFLGIVLAAGIFQGGMDRFVFDAARWSPAVHLNIQLALALLVGVYSLFCFSEDQPMYWREASHGLNRLAFFLGRTLIDTLDWYLMTFVLTFVYYMITVPKMHFRHFFISMLLVAWVASGWGYVIACWLPRILGPFSVCLLIFIMGGSFGAPQQMDVFLRGGFWEVIVDSFSFTRWSAAMSFQEYIHQAPPQKTSCWADTSIVVTGQYDLFKRYYDQANLLDIPRTWWWTPLIALLLQGLLLRGIAYFGLRFTNRNKQD